MISLDKIKLMYGGDVTNIDSNTYAIYRDNKTIVISELGEKRLRRCRILGRSRNLVLISYFNKGHAGLILELKNLENNKSEILNSSNLRVTEGYCLNSFSTVDRILHEIKMCNKVCIYKLDTTTNEFMLLDYNLDIVDKYKCSVDTNYIDYTVLDMRHNFNIDIGNIKCDKYFISGSIDDGKIYGESWKRD